MAFSPPFPRVLRPAFGPGLSTGATLVLRPDASAGIDTRIYQAAPTTNYGTSDYLHVAGNPGGGYAQTSLLKFDLSSVSGKTVTVATLYLYQRTTDYGVNGVQSTIHRVQAANSGWTEGGATWNTIDGSTAWAGSAGCLTSGTDYVATVMGTLTWVKPAAAGTEYAIALLASEVTALASANYGIAIIGVYFGDVARVYSSDGPASYRPKLVVTYQ